MGFLNSIKDAVTTVFPVAAIANGLGGDVVDKWGGLFGGGGGDSGANTSTFTQLPWNSTQLKFLQDEAKKLYEQGPQKYYPGSTVAGMNPELQATLQKLMGFGDTANVQAGQGALDQALSGLSGVQNQVAGEQVSGIGDYANYLMNLGQNGGQGNVSAIAGATDPTQAINDLLAAPGQNPYIDQLVSQVTGDLSKNLNENIMPRIDQGALAANQYGGSRQGLAQGKAIDATQKQAADAATKIRYGDYADTQNRRLSAAGLASNVAQGADSYENQLRQFGLQGADLGRGLYQDLAGITGQLGSMAPLLQAYEGQNLNTQLQGGQLQQQYLQSLLNDKINRFNFNQGADQQNLQNYANILFGSGGLGSTQTSTQAQPQASLIEKLLGGAGTGLGAYSMLAATPAAPYALPLALGLGGLSAAS